MAIFGPAHAIVLEQLVKRRDARFTHPRLHQFADAVIDHGGGDACSQPEAIRQAGGDVVLAAGDMHLERTRLAERHHARIESVNERPQREKVELAGIFTHTETVHGHSKEANQR